MASTQLPSRNFTEDDFNFLYHLEQITEVLTFSSIPTTSRIILPNLRIIRGNALLSGYAMSVMNADVGEFILPNLTEITHGNVQFDQPSDKRLCNLRRVKWTDIIDDGQLEDNSCISPTQQGMV